MTASTLTAPPRGRGPAATGDRPPKRRRRGIADPGRGVAYVVAAVVIVAMLAPVAFIVIGGFRTNAQITTDPSGFPSPWQVGNYLDVLTGGTFWRQVGNSLISAGATTIGTVALGLAASYVLARYRFAGRGVLYALFAAGLMFPMTVAITPLYLVIRDLGLTNSLAGVILPQIAFALPTTIIILVPFLRAIPDEIEEAAFIDGCSRLVITVGILAFIGAWNSYLLPLFILNDPSTFTLPLGVQAFSSQYSVDTARVLAFTALSMLPALIFFSLFERRIVGGLTGAVKG
jgi:raffinose/stachyose/melibiose transport system permease protein